MTRYLVVLLLCLQSLAVFAQDLLVAEYKGSTTFEQHELFSETYTIKNNGIIAITSSTLCLAYLSKDPIYQYGDAVMGNGVTQKLQPGESVDVVIDALSVDVEPGTYYLIVELDAYNEIKETDEENNFFVIPGVTVTQPNIDWSIPSVTLTMDRHPGEAVDAEFTIQNSGSTKAGGFLYYNFWLSKDAIVDNSDESLLGTRVWAEGEATIPVVTSSYLRATPGVYYVIGQIDPHNDFHESDETNNLIIQGPFTIEEGDIDIALTGPLIVNQSAQSLDISFMIDNIGTTGVGEYLLMAYLCKSPEEYLGGFPLILSHGYLDPAEAAQPFYVSIPSYRMPTIEPGAYYVVVVANDAYDRYPESNYSNNQLASDYSAVYIMPPPEPKIATLDASFVKPYNDADTRFDFTITFENSGDPVLQYISYSITLKNAGGETVAYSAIAADGSIQGVQSVSGAFVLDNVLPAGNYTMEITTQENASTTPFFSIPFVIAPAAYTLSGTIQGTDGVPLNNGKLFVYHKEGENITFINSLVFNGTNSFSFHLNDDSYTLYFIPDATAYPEFVPTIYEKTVLLDENSFFNLNEDLHINFEILKIEPLADGPMSITGNIFDETDSRGSAPGRSGGPATGVTVILLSSNGTPVGVTSVDDNGYYEFLDIPQDIYQILIAFELDQVSMKEPIQVDVRNENAVIDVSLLENDVVVLNRIQQEIVFDMLEIRTYGDAPFEPQVTATSNLPVILHSSDEEVAIINNGSIEIVGAGKSTITATQNGDLSYGKAVAVSRELIIYKRDQVITFNQLEEASVGEPDFMPMAASSSGLALRFTSTHKGVAIVTDDNHIHIVGPGTTTITAWQSGNRNYNAANAVSQTLNVRLISEISTEIADITVYPNPAQNILHLESSRRIDKAIVTNGLGVVQPVSILRDAVDISNLANGLYILNLTLSGKSKTIKFIKN
jgi:hypothetical protein